jgi:hypothetical protein
MGGAVIEVKKEIRVEWFTFSRRSSMRTTSGFAALAVAILLSAITAAPSASAATTDDACALVTQAQVSAAVGVSVGAGTHVPPSFVKTCTWSPTGGAREDVKSVTVSFQNAGSYDAGKRVMQQTQAVVNQKEGGGAMASDSASGIGDDAYYTTMGTGYTGLMVKKGNVAMKIAVYGGMPTDKKKTAEKTLALQALSKL